VLIRAFGSCYEDRYFKRSNDRDAGFMSARSSNKSSQASGRIRCVQYPTFDGKWKLLGGLFAKQLLQPLGLLSPRAETARPSLFEGRCTALGASRAV
jgi:hypothetical protein